MSSILLAVAVFLIAVITGKKIKDEESKTA